MWSPQIYSRDSSLFQTVPLDSMWSLHGLHMDSTWSLWRLLGTSRKCFHRFPWSPRGVSVESPWSPHGVHVDSLWTPQSLHGLRGNLWGSVKCSHLPSLPDTGLNQVTWRAPLLPYTLHPPPPP